MALYVKDGLAMRLTSFKNRTARAMAALALAASAGCQKLPYIDQSKAVPHDSMGTIEQEDQEVKQATYLGTLPMPCPGWRSRGRPTTPRRRKSGR